MVSILRGRQYSGDPNYSNSSHAPLWLASNPFFHPNALFPDPMGNKADESWDATLLAYILILI